MSATTAQEKVILITGATNGLGKATALELARQGATVVIVGRSAEKTAATLAEIKHATGTTRVDSLLADLSSLAQVRKLAADFKQRYARLDVLINNAASIFSTRQETVDSFEMTFAVNHLAPFLLTHLLLDVIKASAPSRIINVSSTIHKNALASDLEDLQGVKYGRLGYRAYTLSKLANVLFTYELARRLEGTGVTTNTLHPGMLATGFASNNRDFVSRLTNWLLKFGTSPQKAAELVVYLALSPEAGRITGKYWQQDKAIPSSPLSYDEAAAKRLWNISAELTGLAQPERA